MAVCKYAVDNDCLGEVADIRDVIVLSLYTKASFEVSALWSLGQMKSLGIRSVVPEVSSAGEQSKFTLIIVWMDSSLSGRK